MAGLRPRRDHPRVCGEKALTSIPRDKPQGSPPRVRGKVSLSAPIVLSSRITPACAGKSIITIQLWTIIGDHPRVCGEKAIKSNFTTAWEGSPPRVRGKD